MYPNNANASDAGLYKAKASELGVTKFDFRSDTSTVPTKAMYEAMLAADVGDDVLGEDPTVNALEQRVAELCGHEAGMMVATGTMGNQLCIRAHVQPFQSVLLDHRAHSFEHEAGGISFHSNAQSFPLLPENGRHYVTVEQFEKAIIDSTDVHYVSTGLICLENTLFGMVIPYDELEKISKLAGSRNIKIHLDGARLWNASVAENRPLKEYGKLFDSISLCFSKGLGCPIGSVIVGSRSFIDRARRYRKIFGGGWRQAGVLAAACLYSLDNVWPGMKTVHENAALLGTGLSALGFQLANTTSQTNMVWIAKFPKNYPWTPAQWHERCQQNGLIMYAPGADESLRLVLHHQISRDAVNLILKLSQPN